MGLAPTQIRSQNAALRSPRVHLPSSIPGLTGYKSNDYLADKSIDKVQFFRFLCSACSVIVEKALNEKTKLNIELVAF